MKYSYSSLGKLVSFRNSQDFEIIGMLFQYGSSNKYDISNHTNKRIVIHIHGSYGNFYQNKFIWHMSKIYCENEVDFLSINTSAHDGLAEGYYGKNLKYVGGGVSEYQDSQFDIQAAIDFAISLGYIDIILQGHSLGCDKVIDYSLHSEKKLDIILLSPADSYALQADWIKPDTVEKQIVRIRNGLSTEGKITWGKADFDWLENSEYGAHGNDENWIYEIPITRKALLSILTGSAFKYLNLELAPEFYLDVNAMVYIGKRDGLLFCKSAEMSEYLSKKFKSFFPILDLDADHDIVGVEEVLIKRIVLWIQNRS